MEPSPVSRLFAELRNKIYSFAFLNQPHIITTGNVYEAGLTRTCRQIRKETLMMFYTETKFTTTLRYHNKQPLFKCVTTLSSEKTIELKRLVINVESYSSFIGDASEGNYIAFTKKLCRCDISSPGVEWDVILREDECHYDEPPDYRCDYAEPLDYRCYYENKKQLAEQLCDYEHMKQYVEGLNHYMWYGTLRYYLALPNPTENRETWKVENGFFD